MSRRQENVTVPPRVSTLCYVREVSKWDSFFCLPLPPTLHAPSRCLSSVMDEHAVSAHLVQRATHWSTTLLLGPERHKFPSQLIFLSVHISQHRSDAQKCVVHGNSLLSFGHDMPGVLLKSLVPAVCLQKGWFMVCLMNVVLLHIDFLCGL